MRNIKLKDLGSEYSSNTQINGVLRLYFGLPYIENEKIEYFVNLIFQKIESIDDKIIKQETNINILKLRIVNEKNSLNPIKLPIKPTINIIIKDKRNNGTFVG